MAVSKELQAALEKVDAATTAIGERVSALAARISTEMTDADVADVTAKLNADADKLAGIASDPANPVPAP